MVNTTSPEDLEREARGDDGVEMDAVEDAFDGIDPPFVDDDGETLAEDALDELAEAEVDGIERVRAALDAERDRTRAALERYRDAVLAAEPALPADLVRGETLEELEASIVAAREVVAGVRERLASGVASSERGFPAGAPARNPRSTSGLTPAEKIRAGLGALGP